nr:restriction endonuclease [Variovorax boronicumulans]
MPDEVGVVKVSAVTWGRYQEQESKTCVDADRVNDALFIAPGDFLFSRANTMELVGACVIAEKVSQRVMLSDKILRFQFLDEGFKPWVLHLLRSHAGRQQIEALSSGNQESMRNIGQEKIQQIQVPVPPASERVRVMAQLEELLSDLDAGVAELKAAQRKLAQYRQSLLKAAVEGALTAAWRAARAGSGAVTETGGQLLARILQERRARWEARQRERFAAQGKALPKDWQKKYPEPMAPDTAGLPELPHGWVWASVDQLCEIQGGLQKQPSRAPVLNKFPFLRVANVLRGQLLLHDLHEIELFGDEAKRLVLERNDLLIVEGNGSRTEIGRCARWDGSVPNAVHQNHLIRARCVVVDSAFLEAWLNSPLAMSWIAELAATTSGLYTLSVSKIAKVPVPLPPLDEQLAAVKVMGPLFLDVDRQEGSVSFGLRQSAAQRQNILRAAFSGQLVPQDPADEPASALLARIRAARSPSSATTRPRRGRARKEAS